MLVRIGDREGLPTEEAEPADGERLSQTVQGISQVKEAAFHLGGVWSVCQLAAYLGRANCHGPLAPSAQPWIRKAR